MYDTVIIKSPEIDPETVEKVMQFCRRYEGIDIFTGEILYRFTSGDLEVVRLSNTTQGRQHRMDKGR